MVAKLSKRGRKPFHMAVRALSMLPRFLDKDLAQALNESRHIRQAAIDTFGMDAVGPLWTKFLGAPAMAVAA